MPDIIHMRARRFQALYTLLTGAARQERPTRHQVPDTLLKDVGLPERNWSNPITGWQHTFTTAPNRQQSGCASKRGIGE
ncbi:hypothetical protein [Aestuariibius sp. HNIBRBA575]|uniref:hypothetical protein n=1 Tax=Aestuariibius sp. HNIBRBA575 TaxID=3233343 RepID=UPI0034A4EFFC